MKKSIALILCLAFVMSGCASAYNEPNEKQYTATFLSLFDTVTTIVGKAESEEVFNKKVQPFKEKLEHYHKLFDIYNEYEGLNNIKTLNDSAAISPVKADIAIIELLEDAKRYYDVTQGRFNPAMGAVLSLWHDAREDGINNPANAYLPSSAELENAGKHMNPDSIIIDRENMTVFFTDPDLKLDVGGIAKGWAVQRICEQTEEGLLISVGGNVYATGAKDAKGTPWAVGITNPSGGDYLHILNIKEGSVVTSGSYHRAYAVDGRLYHHIIDPNTLYPSEYFTSVTVVCRDSGLADVLSTTLFLMELDEGMAFLEDFDAEAMWVDEEGNKYYSPGFRDFIRN